MFKLLFLPVRIVFWLLKFSGVKGALLLAIGVGIGMLIAPEAGAELRAKLQQRLEDQRAG
ncbi:MAG: YtxH domain-containing protein [Acidimicrobiales bacterium]